VNDDDCLCGTGQPDTGLEYAAARDLDHTNSQVTNGIRTYMNLLKNIGFTGIRYDYSMGYRASIQETYTNVYAPNFCVAEIWTTLNLNNINGHRQIEMNYMNGDGSSCSNSSDPTCGGGNGASCGTFDFTTHGLLVEALTNNDYNMLKDSNGTDPAGAIGWWPAMQVTFVDNHDTGPAENCSSGQNLWPVPCASVMQGYAYILTHPGIPTIFYPHVYNWGLRSSILTLINTRMAAGLNSTSAVTIQITTTGLYAAIITGTTHQIAMKIGPNSWSPGGTHWILQTSGPSYAVWMD
jgi:alpha-amylase